MQIQEKPVEIRTLEGPSLLEQAAKSHVNDLDKLYQNILEKNLHEIEQDQKSQPQGLMQKLKEVSRVLFSRESTYRGLIDILAEELPSLIVESFRGINSTLEHLFKYVVTTSIIMGVPWFAKIISGNAAKGILKTIDPKQHGLALLFNRKDLEDEQNFSKAKTRIVKEEVLDQMNLVRLWGKDSQRAQEHIKKAEEIKEFIKNIENSDQFRKEALKLKDEVVKKQTLLMSVLSGAVPYIVRLFRKFVLGVDRFTGSINYLNDKDAKKLGSEGFTLRQGLGTLACMFTSPFVANNLLNKFNNETNSEQSDFTKMMKNQLDTKHSFFPKVGVYILSSSIPYLISRLCNAQDKYEFLETLIKSTINGGSLFFGDRLTNGNFAKQADKELQARHGSKEGILHEPEKEGKGFWAWLSRTFPEARKFPDIIARTEHNSELQKDAVDKYQTSFLKGFFSHSFGIAIIKFLINKLTQVRVTNDLKKVR